MMYDVDDSMEKKKLDPMEGLVRIFPAFPRTFHTFHTSSIDRLRDFPGSVIFSERPKTTRATKTTRKYSTA
ncbi:hypothetical protein EAE99_012089 [Botrytis elliptica]|nr:hypothetical protein EAE99_012089 [Botrytis elliptica]